MPDMKQMVDTIADEFQRCQPVLTALGDENRQHLILEMMRMGSCHGVRVGQITERTNLSRPAVSHHLKILREAGLIKMRREGTKNFYYFDTDPAAMKDLQDMLTHTRQVMALLPGRGETDD
ncbi:MAG: metalloregulator ArsR/SmtB family transcription factor [Atopobiaceae bacterium]|nr:metalloregulator ArsR/SmtB family transcription factor [Atopobiaceae bacterium]MCH4181225.1 metalloregulator ArsR/SmtB family transcription factor [Atopobiaceae bacterium]MCH4214643.1 metalloregulator ArsR/SmtB family transcription factor [Atopobiaceae bacterium]MCH4230150.1 metalloregulator ArsR/SmtB family transcription factor [Atopobiaceae bacterium]MCH4275762.1 metalloregulator ArsR/SmtB family transcription factor [Atopobiaceae bacterium]